MKTKTKKDKRVKAITVVEKWLKTCCIKGEPVEIIQTPTVLVIRKLAKDEVFSYAYKRVEPLPTKLK